MRELFRATLFAMAAILVVSCGGGGGGTAATPTSSGGAQSDTLSLSLATINFEAVEFEPAPDRVTVTASITGSKTEGITFGTLPGVDSLPRWLNVEFGNLVNNSVNADFIITTIDQPEGNYNFTVRAVTFDAQENVLNTADIVINYTVTEGVPLTVSPTSVDVTMHPLSDPIPQTISVNAGNYEWSAFSSEATLDVETATGPQDINLEILPPMADFVGDPNGFQGVVSAIQNGTSNEALYSINYTVVATLESPENDIFANAIEGTAATETVGVNLIGKDLNWEARSDVSWATLSETSGVIATEDDLIGVPEGDDFSILVGAGNLPVGRHEGLITITAEAEQSISIPVIVEVGAQKLSPSKRGIALSDTADGTMLQSTVDVFVNADRVANWTASTDASWLSVTPSGTTDDQLIVTANTTGLVDEMTTQAVITISSPDAEITDSETIRVGVWKSANAASDAPVAVGTIFPEDLIVSDPVRPLAYVHSGEQEINIVNVYTGAIEKTLMPAERIFNFDVSDDGAFLYLIRNTDDTGFIDVVDLETQEISTTWSYTDTGLGAGANPDVGFGRISNKPYLFTSSGVILDASTGDVQPLASGRTPSNLIVKNEIFCTPEDDTSEADLGCHKFVSAGFDGARLSSVLRASTAVTGGDTRLSPDGSRVFLLDGDDLQLFDTSDMSLMNTVATDVLDIQEAAFISAGDQLYLTYRNDEVVPTNTADPMVDGKRFLRIYDRDLALVREVDYPAFAGGLVPLLSATALSGDDQRIIYLTDEGTLEVNFFSVN